MRKLKNGVFKYIAIILITGLIHSSFGVAFVGAGENSEPDGYTYDEGIATVENIEALEYALHEDDVDEVILDEDFPIEEVLEIDIIKAEQIEKEELNEEEKLYFAIEVATTYKVDFEGASNDWYLDVLIDPGVEVHGMKLIELYFNEGEDNLIDARMGLEDPIWLSDLNDNILALLKGVANEENKTESFKAIIELDESAENVPVITSDDEIKTTLFVGQKDNNEKLDLDKSFILGKAQATYELFEDYDYTRISAYAEDNVVSMLGPQNKIVDEDNNSWKIRLTNSTLKKAEDEDEEENGENNYLKNYDIKIYYYNNDEAKIEGLPEGLEYEVERLNDGELEIIINGTADPSISEDLDLYVIVKNTAIKDAIRPVDSYPIEVIIEVGYPRITDKTPYGEDKWFSSDDLFPVEIDELGDATRYFLRLTFDDPDEQLQLNNNFINRIGTSTVYSEGGSQANMIDADIINHMRILQNEDEEELDEFVENYIFNREDDKTYLFIPVRPLRPQTTYEATIRSNIVEYADSKGNEETRWPFTMMAVPMVTGVSVGSVGEDYSSDFYIEIRGDYFYEDTVQVYFGDTRADKVRVKDDFLKVYLPTGRDRLEPGTYDILVTNHDDYEQTLYGQFSVVKSSELPPPRDGERVKYSDRNMEVIETVKRSEDTIELSSRYSNRNYIELDLDDLMGPNVRSRKITYEGYRGDRTRELETLSQWADVTLHGVTLSTTERRDDIEIRLGRAPASVTQNLRSHLRNQDLKSDFIEVGGENFRTDRIDLRIPYQNSDGEKIKVLRYDEMLRSWYEVPFTINRLDQNVTIQNTKPGIFVVVE
ncbi:hypothetical protein SYNTR_2095 [Candidatus Syntrophocurvum alkaliphilum]|uniref:Uncharacterized protein n=1 Tax=Candidatus Syntrophocurvum alkaliphilum TaxID=2293317 RepID=A0A6I6DJ95_9FIRM|nr:hypothetical protein [Candidatus Syntrophocurvum alkaliphilum]QGU00689.1 hypothetical protein SYNTR_2095 [Candidatus Syntrophocurvum alkaliphilum]